MVCGRLHIRGSIKVLKVRPRSTRARAERIFRKRVRGGCSFLTPHCNLVGVARPPLGSFLFD